MRHRDRGNLDEQQAFFVFMALQSSMFVTGILFGIGLTFLARLVG